MAQYAILRFAKYKGPEISGIEAHNERTKEKYASNPDIDPTRTHLNFHLIKPERKYRAESEKQIAEAGCRTRSDSVCVVEALITATPEFFKGKKRAEIKEFFNEALEFIKQNQAPETIISAVVHLDEKSPHMHLCFVPLTEDKRLCAKEILGNKKKLTQWQDKYWEHMVKKYPDLERGESAIFGHDHNLTNHFVGFFQCNCNHERGIHGHHIILPALHQRNNTVIVLCLTPLIPGADLIVAIVVHNICILRYNITHEQTVSFSKNHIIPSCIIISKTLASLSSMI